MDVISLSLIYKHPRILLYSMSPLCSTEVRERTIVRPKVIPRDDGEGIGDEEFLKQDEHVTSSKQCSQVDSQASSRWLKRLKIMCRMLNIYKVEIDFNKV